MSKKHNNRPHLRNLVMMIVILIGLTVTSTQFAWTQEKDDAYYTRMCGPLSLRIICEMLGQDIDPETVVQMARSVDDPEKIKISGTSMKALADVAHKLGFKAVGMKMKLQHLQTLGKPAIAHTTKNGRNHFLVVESLINGKFRLIDVDETTQLLSPDEFSKIWKGTVLVISKPSHKTTTEKPIVEANEVLYDFGFAGHMKTIKHIFKLKNVGKQPLIIKELKQSCACTAVLLSKKDVLQNETAEIQVKLDTFYHRGRQTASVKVHTNDTHTPIVYFTITGVIAGHARVVPNNLHLKNIQRTEKTQRIIDIYDPGDRRLKVKKVTSSSPYITAKIQPVYEDILTAKILVTIKTGIPLGKLDEKLTIVTEGYKHPIIEVLVKGNVVGALNISPSQFFLGFVKKGSVTNRVVRLRNNGAADFKILRIESGNPSIAAKFKEIQPRKEYDIVVTYTASASQTGKVQDNIKIYTNDSEQSLLEVPLYAIVK